MYLSMYLCICLVIDIYLKSVENTHTSVHTCVHTGRFYHARTDSLLNFRGYYLDEILIN